MPNKQIKTGRSKTDRFVQLPHWLLKSGAFRSLTPQARAVYLELMVRYNGENNGRIGLGEREVATACNISKNTAPKAFRELFEKGFIERMQVGVFAKKDRKASEWRLTALPCDVTHRVATKEFMTWGTSKWAADPRTQRNQTMAPSNGARVPQNRDTKAPNEGTGLSEN